MADFTKTITVGINLLGEEPPTRFGQSNGASYTMVWGTSKWGSEGNSLIIDTEKIITNTTGVIATGTVFVAQQFVASITAGLFVSMVGDPSSEKLSQGDWNYVFGSSAEADGRSTTTWTGPASPSTTWTSGAAASTSWT